MKKYVRQALVVYAGYKSKMTSGLGKIRMLKCYAKRGRGQSLI
nr:MAG TPA: hypothetical protein [Caudoviricetes sp.]DAR97004.1 MAG TPA: hypothetical protein [Caudoviricetes sp.]